MKLSDVLFAIEMTDDNCKGFYDLVTKRIEWLDEFGMTRFILWRNANHK